MKWPHGRKKRNIGLVVVTLIVFTVIILASMIVTHCLSLQKEIIDNYLIRTAFEGYQRKADAVAQLKKTDFQEVFRELQFGDSLITLMINNDSLVSNGYLEYAKTHKLMSGSEVLHDLPNHNQDMIAYSIFSQEMNFDILQEYPFAAREVDYGALIEYYFSDLFQMEILDLDKDLLYIGWYSELFGDYPSKSYLLYDGDMGTTDRIGFNFSDQTYEFYPTIREWFDKATLNSDLTTMVSTYVYAGKGSVIGTTLAKAIIDENNNIRGVLGYDVIPYTNNNNKDDIIK